MTFFGIEDFDIKFQIHSNNTHLYVHCTEIEITYICICYLFNIRNQNKAVGNRRVFILKIFHIGKT